jgi:hypothetical protein
MKRAKTRINQFAVLLQKLQAEHTEDEHGAASPFLLLKPVSDNVDWPDNENRVHGKRCRRMNGRH